MAELKDTSGAAAEKITSFEHDENRSDDESPEMPSIDINYDSNGVRGILNSPYVFGAALLASFGGFSFGYDQGVISLILVMPQFVDQFPQVGENAPNYGFNKGFLTGMLELGAFVGCLLFPYLADRISRKWGISIATAFFTIGAIIQTSAQNYDSLVAGRFIGGIGVGTLALGAPLYISEIAPPNLRGSLMVLESISIVIGAIVAYWITYGTRAMSGDWAYRLPFLLQIIPGLVVGLGIHFFPFSPRWLALRDRNQESLQALSKLRRLPTTDETVQLEWRGILTEDRFQKQILRNQHPNTGPLMMEIKQWLDLFRPKYFKRTCVAIAIPFFQQFSGINAFVYYAPTFFTELGQDYNMSLILSGMVNICQLVGNIPILLYMDKIGRRRIGIYGALGMAIPHLIMAGVVSKFSSSWESHPAVGWFGVALVYIYVLAYALSYGPLAWVLPAEVFPSSRRAKGVGIATATNWLANFIIGTVVPQMLVSIGWGTFLFFGVWCLIASVFSFFFVRETSNRTLEQVAAVFGDNLQAEEEDLRRQVQREVWAETSVQPQTP
ncbi:uncharacterized protein N7496_000799 [Penicillium cataractarum]|uniref:Major facilitator superfamily (MFS) profile domain-containing protein n=1 Tax=Penicillium cataractarum TaxID=2100454 RepID=A0A9W9VUS0_9EURO|nr:uncharacterized protein N7496_000799 [Penicillium cataractarum]KAJ5389731.1 hypothetical protein N7496_000799 [Penicillium cataractarum]